MQEVYVNPRTRLVDEQDIDETRKQELFLKSAKNPKEYESCPSETVVTGVFYLGNGLYAEPQYKHGKMISCVIKNEAGEAGSRLKYDHLNNLLEFSTYTTDGVLDGPYVAFVGHDNPMILYTKIKEAGFYSAGRKEGIWISVSSSKGPYRVLEEGFYNNNHCMERRTYQLESKEYHDIAEGIKRYATSVKKFRSPIQDDVMCRIVAVLQNMEHKTLTRRRIKEIEEEYKTIQGKTYLHRRSNSVTGEICEYNSDGDLILHHKEGKIFRYFPGGKIQKKSCNNRTWEFDVHGKTIKMEVNGHIYDFANDVHASQKLIQDHKKLKKADHKNRQLKLEKIRSARIAKGLAKKKFMDHIRAVFCDR